MRTLKTRSRFSTHKIELYDSIYDLTIERDHEINKLLMWDIGVGSTPDHINEHLGKLFEYAGSGNMEAVQKEARNLHNSYWNAIQKLNAKSLSFAPLVHSIDGKVRYDLSFEKAKETVKMCSDCGLKNEQVSELVDEIKKKFTRNSKSHFLADMELEEMQTLLSN